jgi:hypothetical protein
MINLRLGECYFLLFQIRACTTLILESSLELTLEG